MITTRKQVLDAGFVYSSYTDINGLPAQAVLMWDDNFYYLAVEMTIDDSDIRNQIDEPSSMLEVLRDSELMCEKFGLQVCSELDMVNSRLKAISGDHDDPEFYYD